MLPNENFHLLKVHNNLLEFDAGVNCINKLQSALTILDLSNPTQVLYPQSRIIANEVLKAVERVLKLSQFADSFVKNILNILQIFDFNIVKKSYALIDAVEQRQ